MNWTIQRLALAAALGLTLAACGGDSGSDGGATPQPNEPEEPETPVEPEPEPEPTVLERVRFLTIGDSGSGSDGAYAVGQAMADICAVKLGAENDPERAGCDFVVGLGDNIYESGVT
ncbi:MAG TPA: serine/threonine protein phosphatase, partial [Alcanivorax sp.]|nr:serine/threonine protein phosphatase [Alcanivorax sp.]